MREDRPAEKATSILEGKRPEAVSDGVGALATQAVAHDGATNELHRIDPVVDRARELFRKIRQESGTSYGLPSRRSTPTPR